MQVVLKMALAWGWLSSPKVPSKQMELLQLRDATCQQLQRAQVHQQKRLSRVSFQADYAREDEGLDNSSNAQSMGHHDKSSGQISVNGAGVQQFQPCWGYGYANKKVEQIMTNYCQQKRKTQTLLPPSIVSS
jgi:hypothetical protein